MSLVLIRAALRVALDAIAPPLGTTYENEDSYKPQAGTPYQQVFLLAAQPDNTEFGPNFQQSGILQVNLRYPTKIGTGEADARAELIRSAFPRGLSLASGGLVVTIDRTAEIHPPMYDADRYVRPVRVFWFAQLPST